MLEEETEIWVESVWESMSEQLRKKVVIAVDTGLMSTLNPDTAPDSEMKGLSGHILDEAKMFSGFGGALEEIPLGRHDIRSEHNEGFGNFKISDALSTYVLVRVLL